MIFFIVSIITVFNIEQYHPMSIVQKEFCINRGVSEFEKSNFSISQDSTASMQEIAGIKRPGFGDYAIEWCGATGGGLLAFGIAYGSSRLFKSYDQTAALTIGYCIVVPLGIATGATLTGNYLTEPNGSFFGAYTGSLLCCSVHLILIVSPEVFGITAIIPGMGAVMGYNSGGVSCFLSEKHEFDGINNIKISSINLQLFKIRF